MVCGCQTRALRHIAAAADAELRVETGASESATGVTTDPRRHSSFRRYDWWRALDLRLEKVEDT
jgi:hypothetical protein